MRVFERKISVYEGKHCKVEIEGKTVSVQWAFPDPNRPGQTSVARGVMPREVAAEFALVLADAVAGAGEVVNDTDIVVNTSAQPSDDDDGREADDVPVGDGDGGHSHTVHDSRRVR